MFRIKAERLSLLLLVITGCISSPSTDAQNDPIHTWSSTNYCKPRYAHKECTYNSIFTPPQGALGALRCKFEVSIASKNKKWQFIITAISNSTYHLSMWAGIGHIPSGTRSWIEITQTYTWIDSNASPAERLLHCDIPLDNQPYAYHCNSRNDPCDFIPPKPWPKPL